MFEYRFLDLMIYVESDVLVCKFFIFCHTICCTDKKLDYVVLQRNWRRKFIVSETINLMEQTYEDKYILVNERHPFSRSSSFVKANSIQILTLFLMYLTCGYLDSKQNKTTIKNK